VIDAFKRQQMESRGSSESEEVDEFGIDEWNVEGVVDRAEVGDVEKRNVTELHRSHYAEGGNDIEETDSIVVGRKIPMLGEDGVLNIPRN